MMKWSESSQSRISLSIWSEYRRCGGSEMSSAVKTKGFFMPTMESTLFLVISLDSESDALIGVAMRLTLGDCDDV